MKRILLLTLFVVIKIIYCSVQSELSLSTTENGNNSGKLNLSFSSKFSDFNLLNDFSGSSFSGDEFYDFKQGESFQNKLLLSNSFKTFDFSGWLYAELYKLSSKNRPTFIGGLADSYRIKNGLASGGSIKYSDKIFSVKLDIGYRGRNFEKNFSEENEFDSDFFTDLEAAYRLTKQYNLLIEGNLYSDLNQSKQYNYTQLYLGAGYQINLRIKGLFESEVMFLFEDIDYNIKNGLKLSNNLIYKYSAKLLSLCSYQQTIYFNEDFSKVASGSSIIKANLIYTFSFTRNNLVNSINTGLKYFIDNQYGYALVEGNYNKFDLLFFAAYKQYFGNKRFKENQISTGMRYFFLKNSIMAEYCISNTWINKQNYPLEENGLTQKLLLGYYL